MLFWALLLSYWALVSCHPEFGAKVLSNENTNNGLGNYHFAYATSNGIVRNEAGRLNENRVTIVDGSYSYIGRDGLRYLVTFTADETGYHPQLYVSETTTTSPEEYAPFNIAPPKALTVAEVIASLLG